MRKKKLHQNAERIDFSMRQAELFPLLVDQEHVDEYVSTQESLKYWKKQNLVFKNGVYTNLCMIQDCKNLRGSLTASEIEIQQLVKTAKDNYEYAKSWELKTRKNVIIWQDFVKKYGKFFARIDEF